MKLTGKISGGRWNVGAGETLEFYMAEISGGVSIRGQGNVLVTDSFLASEGLGFQVTTTGRVDIDRFDLTGPGKLTPGTKFSGLIIHGAKGGTISNVHVADFNGNAYLLESNSPESPIERVTLSQLTGMHCGGGIWLVNATGCRVSFAEFLDCQYPDEPIHRPGHVYPCVRDERIVGGLPMKGTTRFRNISCK